MVRLTLVASFALALAACGSDNGTKAPDGPTADSAPAGTVVAVSCAGITPAMTVTATDGGYMPATATIMQGQVVLFNTTATHDVTPGHVPPDTTISDPGIHVDFNKTECRMFTQTGDYGFHCSIHMFDGTITVQ